MQLTRGTVLCLMESLSLTSSCDLHQLLRGRARGFCHLHGVTPFGSGAPPGEGLPVSCTPLLPDTLGSTDRGSVSSVGQHPGGIISPICPRISSSSQSEMEIFAAPLPLGSRSCSHGAFSFFFFFWSTVSCAYKSVTAVYCFLSHFEQASLSLQGRRETAKICACFPVCLWLFVIWPAVCMFCACSEATVRFKDTLWTSACGVFFFYLCGL